MLFLEEKYIYVYTSLKGTVMIFFCILLASSRRQLELELKHKYFKTFSITFFQNTKQKVVHQKKEVIKNLFLK